MGVKQLTPEYLGQWVHLRQQLWSLDPVQKYLDAGLEMLESEYLTSFILINDEQHVIAFADASIRHD